MTKLDTNTLTIADIRQGLAAKEFSAVEVAGAYLAAIEAKNKNLNVYLEVFSDVREQAAAADMRLAKGETAPLLGVPLAIKDNILIKERSVSAASKMLDNYIASYDAGAIIKLREAGAVFLGRTNMDEFAMGGSTENSAFGPTKNPVDETRVAGGSSGGSAAAVAAGLAPGALGSDTGGSIRQPAAFCGVVGLKPTYGAVSRSGLMAMASSLDQIGPFAKNTADAEYLYQVIQGVDAKDATSQTALASVSGNKKIIGVPESFLESGVDPEIKTNFAEVKEKLIAAGYTIKPIDLPLLKYALACYYIIMPAEVSSNMARYDGLRYGHYQAGDDLLGDYLQSRGQGLGAEVKRRILLGTYVLSAGYYDAYYAKATAVRRAMAAEFKKVLSEVDAIMLPTTPSPAFKLGEKTADPLQMYLEDIFTVPANLVGVPAISIPSGKTAAGLPLGVQLIAPHFGEATLFKIGQDLEHALH